MTRLFIAAPFLALTAGACLGPDQRPPELTREAVCLQHFANDPVERDRCRLPPESQNDTVPDIRPQDLPIQTDRRQ